MELTNNISTNLLPVTKINVSDREFCSKIEEYNEKYGNSPKITDMCSMFPDISIEGIKEKLFILQAKGLLSCNDDYTKLTALGMILSL